jgi:pimeloyl-ACP methyl ester carboxylesterase
MAIALPMSPSLISARDVSVIQKAQAANMVEGNTTVAYSSSSLINSVAAKKVKVDDIDVSYKMFGKGEPLLLIPGYSMTMDMWDPIVLDKLSSNHAIIIFDNRGIGNTTAGIKPSSIQQFANDTAGLIDALSIKKPVDILGLSMGGFIAQELTLLHPEKVNKLIIHASSCGGKQSLPPQVSPEVMTSMISGNATVDIFASTLFQKNR